jgi:hypothetical protein
MYQQGAMKPLLPCVASPGAVYPVWDEEARLPARGSVFGLIEIRQFPPLRGPVLAPIDPVGGQASTKRAL